MGWFSKKEEVPEIPELPKGPIFFPEPPKKIEIKSVKNVPTQSKYEEQNLNEPIFVRLDKFQDAQKNLENIKDKIAEIESTIKSIKDVKSKEDEEISKWIEDTENLKSLLAEIDEDIFGKI